MGSEQTLVLIDTNIFVIDLRYQRDVNFNLNQAFLDLIAKRVTGFTTVVNLLELCGILSFNLSEKQLLELWFYFYDRYKVTVLPDTRLESNFPTIKIQEIFDLLKKKTSFGDAMTIAIAKKHLSFISTMITWDKGHFEGKFSGTVLTPEEFNRIEQA